MKHGKRKSPVGSVQQLRFVNKATTYKVEAKALDAKAKASSVKTNATAKATKFDLKARP